VGGAFGAGFPESEMCVQTRSCGFVDRLVLQVGYTHSGLCISDSGRLGIYGGVVSPESLLTPRVCPPLGLGCVSEHELDDRLIPHCGITRHPPVAWVVLVVWVFPTVRCVSRLASWACRPSRSVGEFHPQWLVYESESVSIF
jgi:hypothetical protein